MQCKTISQINAMQNYFSDKCNAKLFLRFSFASQLDSCSVQHWHLEPAPANLLQQYLTQQYLQYFQYFQYFQHLQYKSFKSWNLLQQYLTQQYLWYVQYQNVKTANLLQLLTIFTIHILQYLQYLQYIQCLMQQHLQYLQPEV